MKIISVIFFALLLTGTWHMAHGKRAVPQSVHVGIQDDLKQIISEYVQKNLPSSKNLRFDKFWTELVKKDQIRAYFAYTFEDTTDEGEPAEVGISGSALLNKAGETAEESIWNLDELTILDNKVTFNEPIQITAGTKAAEESEAPSTDSPVQAEPAPSKHEH